MKRSAMVLGWIGAIALLIALLWFLPACSVPATIPAFPTESAPVSRESGHVAESRPFDYCAWADRKAAELSERFSIEPPVTEFRNEPFPKIGDVRWLGFELGGIYQLGLYTRSCDLIQVWTQGPDGKPWPEAEVKWTWLHEWLHHLDAKLGKPECHRPHNAEFDKRIADLGLDK